MRLQRIPSVRDGALVGHAGRKIAITKMNSQQETNWLLRGADQSTSVLTSVATVLTSVAALELATTCGIRLAWPS